ncbi:MAG: E3 binding domain-containing protein [Kiritimatiellae bacterium]|nr:E3 binding domain-containing protein [Kiritimatiellia bacterium]
MIVRVRIPRLSTNVTEVTVTAWFKQESDPVRKGEPLAEVTTDKASVELESPASGILRKRLAKTKSIVPVGYVIALIGGAEDPLPDVTQENERLLARHLAEVGGSGLPSPATTAASRVRIRATPAARRLARESHVDLAAVATVLGNRTITEEDIINHLKRQSMRNM